MPTSAHIPAPAIDGAVNINVAGERVLLLPHRAAYWCRERTLIVADLHLGKEEVGRAAGIPLPDALIDESLDRLHDAARQTGARRVLVVGDLVHCRAGLPNDFVSRVASRLAAVDVQVVPGNHDRSLPMVASAWGVRLLPSRHVEAPFAFVHDPAEAHASSPAASPAEWTWCGHLHPAISLGGRVPTKVPCFVIGPRTGVLPAFSPFTSGGGRLARDAAVYAVADGRVIPMGVR